MSCQLPPEIDDVVEVVLDPVPYDYEYLVYPLNSLSVSMVIGN
jgi:hypothetical protein